MPRNASFQRGKPTRAIGGKIIIAVEGKKTEYGYFEAIRKDLRLPSLQVIVVKPPGTDPLGIVRAAISERDARRSDRIWLPGDSAWAVFDGDEHIANDRVRWHEALDLATKHKIGLAISNPSFELWYLLHFQNQTANITRQSVLRAINSHIPNYDKASVLYPTPLKEVTPSAIDRAKSLERRSEEVSTSSHTNPCSGVWNLVTALLVLGPER